MTEIQMKMYNTIKSAGAIRGTATLGFEVWPDGRASRLPQGMALVAGKIAGQLIKLGYVKARAETRGDVLTTYTLTEKPLP